MGKRAHVKKKTNTKKMTRMMPCVIGILSMAVICVAGVCAFHWKKEQQQQTAYETLQQTVSTEEVEQADYTLREGVELDALEDVYGEMQPIDFERLQEYNPELVAWIRIPDTAIDYPVARHEGSDQSYYLYHNMYGETAFAGCIYMEHINTADFSDYNTVLYGHNMKNGSMFAALHEYESMDFMRQHPYIYVYMPEKSYRYTIVAAYSADDTNLNAAFDFHDRDSYASYVRFLENNVSMDAVLQSNVAVTADTKMITLSTCVGNQPERRYLVQGILTLSESGNITGRGIE